ETAFSEVYRVLKPGAYFTIVFQSKFNEIWNELRDIMINRLGFEFVNIVKNERGTTFHTNNDDDTNPQSAFITYKKPIKDNNTFNFVNKVKKDVFDVFPKEELSEPISFREIQSKIIYLVHYHELDTIPSDKEIKTWLESICTCNEGKYNLK
ncbi:hypothetical protein, partial [Clostridium butyricum]